jgi:hypothetical protein
MRLPIHVYGVIVHGLGTWAYIAHDNCKQGTNVTIECLIRTMKNIEDAGLNLPDTCYIQLDNTVKQNKSRFFIA